MAEILKGAPVAKTITDELAVRAGKLRELGIVPTLAIVRIGQRGEDVAYETTAVKRCEQTGIAVRPFHLETGVSREELLELMEQINLDNHIHGCLMFRPLPRHLDEGEICRALKVEKDVDCMTDDALAGVFTGRGRGYPPCTAQSVIELLDYYGIDPEGKLVTVIGRSLVIGKPVSMLLQERNATVTMCHTKTRNIAEICRRSDILVVAAGHAGTVTPEYTNPDQIVVDVGINSLADGSLTGDVDFAAVEPLVKAITPVPAGVGSVTAAVLCKHLIEAAERALR